MALGVGRLDRRGVLVDRRQVLEEGLALEDVFELRRLRPQVVADVGLAIQEGPGLAQDTARPPHVLEVGLGQGLVELRGAQDRLLDRGV